MFDLGNRTSFRECPENLPGSTCHLPVCLSISYVIALDVLTCPARADS